MLEINEVGLIMPLAQTLDLDRLFPNLEGNFP
jgi:hypothetical protein